MVPHTHNFEKRTNLQTEQGSELLRTRTSLNAPFSRIFLLSFSNAKPVREKITKTNLFTEDKVNIMASGNEICLQSIQIICLVDNAPLLLGALFREN